MGPGFCFAQNGSRVRSLAHARRLAAAIGYQNVEFRKGRIQDLKLDRDKVDAYLRERPIRGEADLAAYEALHAPLPVFAAIDYQRSNPPFDLFIFLKGQLPRLAPSKGQGSGSGLRYWASQLLGTDTSTVNSTVHPSGRGIAAD